MTGNTQIQALKFKGESYEYMGIDERKSNKIIKLITEVKNKDAIEFLELNKLKFDLIKQSRTLLFTINDNLTKLKYLVITQCQVCPHFSVQLKKFLDINHSLVTFSLVMNKIVEEDLLLVLEGCFDHPNLEVL